MQRLQRRTARIGSPAPFHRPAGVQSAGYATIPAATTGPPASAPLQPESAGPRLLDRVKTAIQMRHMSVRTEKAYVGRIRRFIIFNGKRHPDEMGEPEVSRFLSALDWLADLVHAKRAERIPVVLTRAEVGSVLSYLSRGPTSGRSSSCWATRMSPRP